MTGTATPPARNSAALVTLQRPLPTPLPQAHQTRTEPCPRPALFARRRRHATQRLRPSATLPPHRAALSPAQHSSPCLRGPRRLPSARGRGTALAQHRSQPSRTPRSPQRAPRSTNKRRGRTSGRTAQHQQQQGRTSDCTAQHQQPRAALPVVLRRRSSARQGRPQTGRRADRGAHRRCAVRKRLGVLGKAVGFRS